MHGLYALMFLGAGACAVLLATLEPNRRIRDGIITADFHMTDEHGFSDARFASEGWAKEGGHLKIAEALRARGGTADMIEIRDERPADIPAIRDITRRAFGQTQEGEIIDALRANGAALLSLVATGDDRVVGHIMYSPLLLGDVTGAALGPMAVLPEYQRQGVGGKLIDGQIPTGVLDGRLTADVRSSPT